MQLMPEEGAAGIPVSNGVMLRNTESSYEAVRLLAIGNALVLFSMSGCCMCTVAKSLLFSLGVGPTVVKLDELSSCRVIHAALCQFARHQQALSAVFVGCKFLGGACHFKGTLVPLLKDAGALWL